MIDLIVLLAAAVAAAGTWVVGGLVLRPLLKLAQSARETEPPAPAPQLPEADEFDEASKADEAVELDSAVGRLNERVETLVVDEQLAADVAKALADLRFPLDELGEGLDQLLDNPEMPATQRHLYLAAIQTEYRRIVTMVDELEASAASR